MKTRSEDQTILTRNSNQALGIGCFAKDFISGRLGNPSKAVLEKTTLFFTDSLLCAISAIALKTNAPSLFRKEAKDYPQAKGVPLFGDSATLAVEKAILSNCVAVREWDANGTNFGYNPSLGHIEGEFGHNDFYPVAIAAAQLAGKDGAYALRGMLLLDEIRGRFAEVFNLRRHKIDHVVHGALASAAVYGAMLEATPEQIESALGLFLAHYIPWRAIRAGEQLSDSKGASAGISTEVAIMSMKRAMRGLQGPKDIFRNPEAIWRFFSPTNGDSPFDLYFTHSGSDFAVMGMHFKLGIYEHQSAGAIHALFYLMAKHPELLQKQIDSIKITIYQPAFSIIADPAKRNPATRQSADHSLIYIISALWKKAKELDLANIVSEEELWIKCMLTPQDYSEESLHHPETRKIMSKIICEHGGDHFDSKYPEGIPTSITLTATDGSLYSSGLILYPAGHARNSTHDVAKILESKFRLMGQIAMDDPEPLIDKSLNLGNLSAEQLRQLYEFDIRGSDIE